MMAAAESNNRNNLKKTDKLNLKLRMDEILLLVKVSGQRPADHSGMMGSSRKVSCQFDSGYIQEGWPVFWFFSQKVS